MTVHPYNNYIHVHVHVYTVTHPYNNDAHVHVYPNINVMLI